MPSAHSASPAWRDPLLPAYLVVAATGLYVTSYGPSLAASASDLGVSKAIASLLLTAMFVGGIIASASVALRLHAADKRRLGAIGAVVMVAGSLVMGASPWWPLALGGSVVLGLGDGLLVTAAHILVAETSPDVPRDMSRLNVSFAFGAMAGPLCTGFVLDRWGERFPLYLVLAVVTLPLAVLLVRPGAGRRFKDRAVPSKAIPAATPRGFDAPVLMLGGVLLLYIGCEAGLGAWVATYTEESFGSGVMLGAAVTSGYWLALGLGRMACSVLLGRGMDAWKLLLLAVGTGTIASAALALAHGTFALAAVAAFFAGLGFGPVWPSALGLASVNRKAQVPATLITVASVGGIVLPFSEGLVLRAAGPAGIAFTAVLCAAMFALTFAAQRRVRGSGYALGPRVTATAAESGAAQ